MGFIKIQKGINNMSKSGIQTKDRLIEFGGGSGGNGSYYGVCSTSASTVAKSVSINGFQLSEGACIFIKFDNTNTAANPTLNVSTTGDKAIYYRGKNVDTNALIAGRIYEMVYDGTNWQLVDKVDKDYRIFAVHYSESDSNPDSCDYPFGYDNYGWVPMYVNLSTGVPVYNSWDPDGVNKEKVRFLFPRSCMLKYDGTVDYYLDESDETKKENGAASDVANSSYAGNAMMEWAQDGQKIYWKILPDTGNNGWTFIVSNRPVDKNGEYDPDMRPWNHYNCDDGEATHWYTSKYFGSYDNTRLRSISGGTNMVSQNAETEINRARANNQNSKVIWDTEVYADFIFQALMMVLLSKSTNSQGKFGYGRCLSSNSSVIGQGTMNTKGMFWGSNDQTSGVKVFGMENPYGNIWRRIRGYILNAGDIKVKMTHGVQDGTSASDYNLDGTGYTSIGAVSGTSGGYISAMHIKKYGLFPKTVSGTDSTYYPDGCYFNNSGVRYAFVGGAWNSGLLVGCFCVLLYGYATITYTYVGAALSCKPLS